MGVYPSFILLKENMNEEKNEKIMVLSVKAGRLQASVMIEGVFSGQTTINSTLEHELDFVPAHQVVYVVDVRDKKRKKVGAIPIFNFKDLRFHE